MEKLKKYRADFAFGTYFCDLLNTATANPLINSGDAVLVVYDESPNTISMQVVLFRQSRKVGQEKSLRILRLIK